MDPFLDVKYMELSTARINGGSENTFGHMVQHGWILEIHTCAITFLLPFLHVFGPLCLMSISLSMSFVCLCVSVCVICKLQTSFLLFCFSDVSLLPVSPLCVFSSWTTFLGLSILFVVWKTPVWQCSATLCDCTEYKHLIAKKKEWSTRASFDVCSGGEIECCACVVATSWIKLQM